MGRGLSLRRRHLDLIATLDFELCQVQLHQIHGLIAVVSLWLTHCLHGDLGISIPHFFRLNRSQHQLRQTHILGNLIRIWHPFLRSIFRCFEERRLCSVNGLLERWRTNMAELLPGASQLRCPICQCSRQRQHFLRMVFIELIQHRKQLVLKWHLLRPCVLLIISFLLVAGTWQDSWELAAGCLLLQERLLSLGLH